MLDDKNYENRNLSEVFKELQEIRNNPAAQQAYSKQVKKTHKPKTIYNNSDKIKKSNKLNTMFSLKNKSNYKNTKTNDLTLSQIVTGCGILVISVALFFPKDLLCKSLI